MLLHRSRQAETLTSKEAGVGGLLAKGVGKGLGAVGRFAKKHPMGTLATVGGGAAAASEMGKGLQRARVGMDPRYLKARQLSGFKLPSRPTMQMSPQSRMVRR